MKAVSTCVCIVALFLTLFSCKQVRKKLLPSINVNIPSINLSIPPLAFVPDKEVPVGALRAPINMDSAIKARTKGTFGADAVTEVKVKKIVLKLLNGDRNNNFSNFESGRIRIYSDTSQVDIATINFPASFTDSLSITPQNPPDISEYLRGRQIAYNLFWKNRKKTTKFLKLDVLVTLGVH
jgi:hypothetical protein